MARRHVLRSWVTASLLVLSGVSAALVAPAPASAAEAITVVVHPTHFQGPDPSAPSRIYAEPNQEIIFKLASPTDRHHTVTILPDDCSGKPRALCDKAFDDPFGKYPDPENPTVTFRWSQEGEYRFYDRYAWEESRREMTGRFIVTHSPPPVQPPTTTSTTATSTTVTTAPPTSVTTGPTTTTSAPTQVRPQLVPDPPSTTTTTAAAVAITTTTVKSGATPPPPAAKKDNKDKDKGKSKPATPETTATTAPLPPDTAWIDSILDPAMLTPSPAEMPDQRAGDPADEVALEAARAANLLDKPASDEGDNKLLLIALAGIAAALLSGGVFAWYTRASRYDPA